MKKDACLCPQVFFDVNVDGERKGRIVVQLFDDVPIGSRRFQDLAEGHEGISYQLSKFSTIAPVRRSLLTYSPSAGCFVILQGLT